MRFPLRIVRIKRQQKYRYISALRQYLFPGFRDIKGFKIIYNCIRTYPKLKRKFKIVR